ncbi:bile acid:sodium symporter family protein [Paenibacillus rigui]|uniref:Bile acid:sodium symporter n=1 Tax=Paenibacillus rigui TaxID=554312 RepID=A0A229US69_9BACL|nr:bile acid:sodium symporter [Paenibacillus rigui]OXM85759.1 hypothetical protein CF651_13735 [Paenibacillus rigui]
MGILRTTNTLLEKWIYLLMPSIMVLGMTIGGSLAPWTAWTSFLFMLLTFLSSLNADYRKFVHVIRKPALLLTFLIFAHLVIPWTVFQMSSRLFFGQAELAAGITLSTLLPLGVTSIFWVAYNKGNVETTLSLVSIDTILSPLIVPLTLSLILSSQVQLQTEALIVSLFKLVLIPTVAGMLVGEYVKKKEERVWFKPASALLGKACLYFIVLLNAASISGQLHLIRDHVGSIIAAVFGTMVFGYVVNFGISKLFTQAHEDHIAISYSGGVRNYTVGVVLATTFFEPIVALPVLLAMLLQHPMALLFYYFFRWVQRKNRHAENAAKQGAAS